MPGQAHIAYTMAGVTGLGGVIGFVKGKSVPSLVGGLVLGAAFGAAGYLVSHGEESKDIAFGHQVAMLASGGLAAGMASRALVTRAAVPVALTAAGLASLGYEYKKYDEWTDAAVDEEVSAQEAEAALQALPSLRETLLGQAKAGDSDSGDEASPSAAEPARK